MKVTIINAKYASYEYLITSKITGNTKVLTFRVINFEINSRHFKIFFCTALIAQSLSLSTFHHIEREVEHKYFSDFP